MGIHTRRFLPQINPVGMQFLMLKSTIISWLQNMEISFIKRSHWLTSPLYKLFSKFSELFSHPQMRVRSSIQS